MGMPSGMPIVLRYEQFFFLSKHFDKKNYPQSSIRQGSYAVACVWIRQTLHAMLVSTVSLFEHEQDALRNATPREIFET